MNVSKATPGDVPELVSLINHAYRGGESSVRGWTSEAHLLDGARIDEETLTGYFNQLDAVMLKYTNESGQIKACVYLQEQPGKLYLGMLTVSPALQAQGVGRGLLAAAERYAKEANKQIVTMTVINSRHELISWYERRGYKHTGELLPFHGDEKFGKPKTFLQLAVMEKIVNGED
jgi:ribosomal protein S18 acetylase RimI-like enzyme